MSSSSPINGPRSPSSGDARQIVPIAPNNALRIANFRPSEFYKNAFASTQNGAPGPSFSAPPAPMAGAIPTNANGLYYGGLPGPRASQLRPITLPSNQVVTLPDDHSAPLHGQQGTHVPSSPEAAHQRRQSSDGSQQDKRHRSSRRVLRSAEEIVAIFTRWLDEYDRRSQERYDAAKKMYNDLHNDHTCLKTEIRADREDLHEKVPRLDQLSELLGECLAGNRRIQEHHERLTRLENRMAIGDNRCEQMSNRFVGCETGLAHMGQRMRQFEDDRMGFVSKDTIDALEISHTQGAESRLRVVADSIRADLAERTKSIDHINDNVLNLKARTIKMENSVEPVMLEKLSDIEKRISKLQHQHREPPDNSDALRRISTLETQTASFKNELDCRTSTAAHLNNVGEEMEQIRRSVRHLQGKHGEFMNSMQALEVRAAKDSVDSLCADIKKYDPSSSTNDGLEQLISAVFSNPILSARLQPNEPRPQQEQSISNSESPQEARDATKETGPVIPPIAHSDTNQAKDNAWKDKARADDEDFLKFREFISVPENGSIREGLIKMKLKRSTGPHDASSGDEITVKRPKTKSHSRT